ncbi:DoxX family protein [Chryseobacterium indoltheticum]|uniref:Predicted membrane protein n=1 Tax=Chryseobacterium indoltheticum TaxID=254 RepID=A0A381FLA7_9FLAO|nr:DoxX family protein [Chryseobacterium indoltheticum]SUX47297.1 Predicted membrane protein [Chryseobacterium indoltheticum]
MFYSKSVLIFFLIIAGILHFVKPHFFMKIMPDYIPYHLQMVYISGAVEILCGILLLFPETQKLGAYLCIALLIAVFPANIEMAKKFYQIHHKYFWLTVLRLPLQVVLIWWAYQFRK